MQTYKTYFFLSNILPVTEQFPIFLYFCALYKVMLEADVE